MGGFGSGGWFSRDGKALADECLCIDINWLNRKGDLQTGSLFVLMWTVKPVGKTYSIEGYTGAEAVSLKYSVSRPGEGQRDINYQASLFWTPCTYGGRRPWFICPGTGCGRRVGKLFLKDSYFLCRHCHKLAYESQRLPRRFRLLKKCRKIDKKLGLESPSSLSYATKPKGMHWKTFHTLLERGMQADMNATAEIAGMINKVLG
jgi:hypothetical protein